MKVMANHGEGEREEKKSGRWPNPGPSPSAKQGVKEDHISGGAGVGSNVLQFYTDDAPGLKISPYVVLITSLYFIGFVTALHVFGKLYRYKSGPGA